MLTRYAIHQLLQAGCLFVTPILIICLYYNCTYTTLNNRLYTSGYRTSLQSKPFTGFNLLHNINIRFRPLLYYGQTNQQLGHCGQLFTDAAQPYVSVHSFCSSVPPPWWAWEKLSDIKLHVCSPTICIVYCILLYTVV